jgi:hypothetical protein
MGEDQARRDYVNSFIDTATHLWGREAVSEIRTILERTAEAVWALGNVKLGPEDEPQTTPTRRKGG